MPTLAQHRSNAGSTLDSGRTLWGLEKILGDQAERRTRIFNDRADLDEEIFFMGEKRNGVYQYASAQPSNDWSPSISVPRPKKSGLGGLSTLRKRSLEVSASQESQQPSKRAKVEYGGVPPRSSTNSSHQSSTVSKKVMHKDVIARQKELLVRLSNDQKPPPVQEQRNKDANTKSHQLAVKSRLHSGIHRENIPGPQTGPQWIESNEKSTLPSLSTSRPQPATKPPPSSRVQPFVIEDDSSVDTNHSLPTPQPSRPVNPSQGLTATQRVEAIIESRRLRKQLGGRDKQDFNPSSDNTIDRAPEVAKESVTTQEKVENVRSPSTLGNGVESQKHEITRAPLSRPPPSGRDPRIVQEDLRKQQKENRELMSAELAPSKDRERHENAAPKAVKAAKDLLPTQDTVRVADLEAESRRKLSEQRAKAAEDETRRKLAEKKQKDAEDESLRQKAEQARKDAEAENRQKDAEQAKKDKKAEIRRNEAEQARKAADAKRKAEWEQRAREKRAAEEKAHEERQKAQAAQREAISKNRTPRDKDLNALAAQASALAKLQDATKAANAHKVAAAAADAEPPSGQLDLRGPDRATPDVSRSEGLSAPRDQSDAIASATVAKEDAARKQRILAKEAAKARNKRAEAIAKSRDDNTADEIEQVKPRNDGLSCSSGKLVETERHMTPQSSSKPMSLHDLAEQSFESSANNKPGSLHGFAGTQHTRDAVGEIREEDIEIWKLRDMGTVFSDIATLLKPCFGCLKPTSELNARYRRIKDAAKAASVPEELITKAKDGSKEARRRISLMVSRVSSTNGQQHGSTRLDESNTARAAETGDNKRRTILPEDIKVLRWRDGGMQWPTIVKKYTQLTDRRTSATTLRRKYYFVKDALATLKPDETLLDAVAANDAHAQKVLNEAVGRSYTITERSFKRHTDSREDDDVATEPRLTLPSKAPQHTTSLKSTAFEVSNPGPISQSTSSGYAPVSPGPFTQSQRHEGRERPEFGGKCLGPESYRYYMEQYAEAVREEFDEALHLTREQSPTNDTDYCHFAYQVQRRQLSANEVREGRNIDDPLWLVCGDDCDDLTESNSRAGMEIMRVRDGVPSLANKRWVIEYDEPVEDRVSFTLKGENTGMVQVRVIRYLRTFQDGKLPVSKERWVPRTGYQVWFKRESKGDELFGESKGTVKTGLQDKRTFTAPEIANEAAVKAFVDVAFTPEADADTPAGMAEIQAVEKQFLAELDEDEGELFDQDVSNEDGSETMRIWVEETDIVGPRNLY